MRIAGSCHCCNIRFELRWLPEPVTGIPARACGCTSRPTGELSVAK